MKILALETCFKYSSAAVVSGGRILSQSTLAEKNRQAEMLITQVDQCLLDAVLNLTKMDIIATTQGPGSFTGVRIGLAAAHGLVFGTTAKIYTLNTLQLIWHFNGMPANVVIAITAGRGLLYVQKFNSSNPKFANDCAVESIAVAELTSYANGSEIISNQYENFKTPTAADLALAAQDFITQGVPSTKAEALYVNPAVF